ncbi:MAG: hypothetical protein ABI471_03560 [Sphingomonas bacterium]
MGIVAILALAAIAAAPVPKPAAPAAAKPVCQKADLSLADGQATVPAVHPLTAEPPAKLILGVLRTVDGCSRPVVVREDVGASRR